MSENTLYQKQIYMAKAKSLVTIDFSNYSPNYFRIVNMGSGELFFSASTSPTTTRFDMKVAPQGSKMHVEPYGKQTVYVFNNSANDAEFALLAFNAPFEPLALAVLSDESLAEVIMQHKDYDGIIRGFNIPLPAGSNTIGAVDVNNNEQLTAIKNAVDSVKTAIQAQSTTVDIDAEGVVGHHIADIENYLFNIRKVLMGVNTTEGIGKQLADILTALENQSNGAGGTVSLAENAQLTDILSAINNQNGGTVSLATNSQLDSIHKLQYPSFCKYTEDTFTSSEQSNVLMPGIEVTGMNNIIDICFISNDSDTETLSIYTISIEGEESKILSLYPNEVCNGLQIYCPRFTYIECRSTGAGKVRAYLTLREVK